MILFRNFRHTSEREKKSYIELSTLMKHVDSENVWNIS